MLVGLFVVALPHDRRADDEQHIAVLGLLRASVQVRRGKLKRAGKRIGAVFEPFETDLGGFLLQDSRQPLAACTKAACAQGSEVLR